MSGEDRRSSANRGWLLPVIVAAAGAAFLIASMRNGTLNAVALKPVNWAGLALMAAGVVPALGRKPLWKLVGTLICGVGAIMVICV